MKTINKIFTTEGHREFFFSSLASNHNGVLVQIKQIQALNLRNSMAFCGEFSYICTVL